MERLTGHPIRKIKKRSGTTSVVVARKSHGHYKEIKTFGTSSSPEEIEQLCGNASDWIKSFGVQQEPQFGIAERLHQ